MDVQDSVWGATSSPVALRACILLYPQMHCSLYLAGSLNKATLRADQPRQVCHQLRFRSRLGGGLERQLHGPQQGVGSPQQIMEVPHGPV
jgi:hypothetical protein